MQLLIKNKNLLNCFEEFDKLKKTNIAVGVSGGIDSLALLLILNEWAKKYNSQITYEDGNDGWLNPENLKIILDEVLKFPNHSSSFQQQFHFPLTVFQY